MQEKNIFIDFDSTFIQVETLDEIVLVSYKIKSQRKKKHKEISRITNLAMSGELDFGKALEARINLLDINKQNIDETTKSLKQKVTPSFIKNKAFIQENKNNIYILSGGFKECITPIAKDFGIDENHIFANEFLYNTDGTVIGVDTRNPLSQDEGKVKVVNDLKLDGIKISIGDGWNDYKLKEGKTVDTFFAFIENIKREKVVEVADEVLESFDDFISWYNKK